jgi:inositol transport system ATP-binding protein
MEQFFKHGHLYKAKERAKVEEICGRINVKMSSIDVPASTLSGGNQQKVVLAKWMLRDPDILILDEPTRGIDVGAKFEIYKLMTSLVKEGKSIVMVSSELPELIGMCDRIYVMSEGRISGELKRSEFSQEKIMRYAMNIANGG